MVPQKYKSSCSACPVQCKKSCVKTGSGVSFLFPRDGFGRKGAQVSWPGRRGSAGGPALDGVPVQAGDSLVTPPQAKLQRVVLGKGAWEQP